jgi:hypothetical protein
MNHRKKNHIVMTSPSFQYLFRNLAKFIEAMRKINLQDISVVIYRNFRLVTNFAPNFNRKNLRQILSRRMIRRLLIFQKILRCKILSKSQKRADKLQEWP